MQKHEACRSDLWRADVGRIISVELRIQARGAERARAYRNAHPVDAKSALWLASHPDLV
jgi:hypothetical protein